MAKNNLEALDSQWNQSGFGEPPFFEPFSFPNFKLFNLDLYEKSQDVLHNIHAKSGFQLEELELSGFNLETDGLISSLQLQPSLIHLSLSYCKCSDNNLFTPFTYDPPSVTPPISLSLLQTFKLQRSTISLDGHVFIGMAESLSAPAKGCPAGHLFPRFTLIDLWLECPQFNGNVELRLASLSATGFLQDHCVRYDPELDDSDSLLDWYISLRALQSPLIFFLMADLNLMHVFPSCLHTLIIAHIQYALLVPYILISTNFLMNYFRIALHLLFPARLRMGWCH
ncbi:hypothetical protein C8J57DRAFT_1511860 [Mycena rebaudengoi]|nr:hypothetical protein C8J57DRAFT_1511860 [Mycena rebaudengoi]